MQSELAVAYSGIDIIHRTGRIGVSFFPPPLGHHMPHTKLWYLVRHSIPMLPFSVVSPCNYHELTNNYFNGCLQQSHLYMHRQPLPQKLTSFSVMRA